MESHGIARNRTDPWCTLAAVHVAAKHDAWNCISLRFGAIFLQVFFLAQKGRLFQMSVRPRDYKENEEGDGGGPDLATDTRQKRLRVEEPRRSDAPLIEPARFDEARLERVARSRAVPMSAAPPTRTHVQESLGVLQIRASKKLGEDEQAGKE